MQTLRLRAHVNPDGSVQLQMPEASNIPLASPPMQRDPTPLIDYPVRRVQGNGLPWS
ncbi:hypothetical protein XM38_017510 [Halomicronema hongdechloris C2206]|uniref:Uncharacterized protein n=1 Tax=Halomicronema hongdechloris C2206 TaxID=1641165 RepID=A0A1Z3HKG0_9CYAN|nr:hypothetical protein [Halomicronema hongdechloris]ASC70804.1 hypothetical protein XM38_017510 [Halomicronema hongdechloris C2206]